MGDFEKWGGGGGEGRGGEDPSNGGMILKWVVDTPLQTMKLFWIIVFLLALYMSLKR